MTVSLRTKVTTITSCIIVVVFLLVSIVYYRSIHGYATHRVYKQALRISEVGRSLIDADGFEQAIQSEDKEAKYYKEVKNTLTTLDHLIEAGNLFAIGIDDQGLVYLSDGVNDYSLLSYERLPKERVNEMLEKLKIGEPYYFKDYYDEYSERFIRGVLVPIVNSNQDLVGMLGYQVEKTVFYESLNLVKWIIYLSAAIIMLVCILLNYFGFKRLLKPVDRLMSAMNKVAKGDFKIDVDINRKDEVGGINRALARSCERLSEMFEHINVSSTNLRYIAEKILGASMKSLVAFEEVANSTKEISLISYEQVDKRAEAKLAVTYLEEDVRIIMANAQNKKDVGKLSEELINQMATHVDTIKHKLDELDRVFEIIDDHTVNLSAVTERQMASSEEFTAMAENLNQEAESLNKSVSRVKV